METFNFSVPQDITVGKGSLSKLPEIAKKLGGKHALIISGPHLEKMGLVKKAADYLASVTSSTARAFETPQSAEGSFARTAMALPIKPVR